mmetsp:Transcript_8918/g.16824  ORF Transcript_8918/g.16824 Transcript_8918/m.16824 type:complete len:875 (+) Transcript_8918:774-3398(+)
MTTYWRRTAATRMSSAAPRPAPSCYHESQEEQQEKENNKSNCWTAATTGSDHEQQCQRNFTCYAAPAPTNSADARRIVYHKKQEEDNKNNDSTNQRRHILRSTGVVSAAAAVGVLADAEFKKMPAAIVVEDDDDDEVADATRRGLRQQEQEQECHYHQEEFLGGRPALLVERTAQSVSRRGDTSSHEDAPSFGDTGQAQQQQEQQYGTRMIDKKQQHGDRRRISDTNSAVAVISGDSVLQQRQPPHRHEPCVMATNIETTPCTTMQSMEHHNRARPSNITSTNEGNGFMSQSTARLPSSQQGHQGHCNPSFENSAQHHHLQHHFTTSTPHPISATFYPYSSQAGSSDTLWHSSFDNQSKTKTRTAPQQGHPSTKGNTPESSYHQQVPSSSYSSSECFVDDASKSGNNPLGVPPVYGPQYATSNYHTTCPTQAVALGDYHQKTRILQPPHYTYPYHPFSAGNASVPYAPHGHFPMHPYYNPNFATQHPNNQDTHPEYLFHGGRNIPVPSPAPTNTAASSSFTSANSISKLTGTTISVNTNASSNNVFFLSDVPDDSPLQTARQREDDLSNTGSLDSPTGDDSNKNTSAKKKRKKKPKDCPRRPLSAYNFFFKDERKKILESIPSSSREQTKSEDDKIRDSITWPGKKRPPHGKIGFENLAKVIGERWKSVDSESMKYYKDLATQDLQRYAEEMKVYEEKQVAKRKSNVDASGTNLSSDNDEDDEGDITRSRHTNQEDNIQCREKHNKRKISTSTHGQELSLNDEVVSSQLKTATNKRRKSPTMKRRSKTNNNKSYHEEYYQDSLEVEEILPQDIDQDGPLINFDVAAVFVNSFSFDNEDMTSSNKSHHGNNSNSSVKGIPFTESWLVDLNHSESS